MAKQPDRVTPPSIAWKAFDGYIEHLHKAKVPPPRIDTSIMPASMSGQVRSQLKAALRFLNLITDDGTLDESFVTLIETYGTDGWPAILATVISDAYAKTVAAVDLKSGTPAQLHQAFRDAGSNGESLYKAVRFYLAALTKAGIGYSPFFEARGAKTIGRKSGRRKNVRADMATGAVDDPDDIEDEVEQSTMTRWPIPIPGKTNAVILVPSDVNIDDWSMIDTVVRAYIDRATKAAQE
jgi:hypothetical protein